MSEPATHYEATDLEHQTEITNTYIDATDINLNNQTATENKEKYYTKLSARVQPKLDTCIAISKVVGTDKDLIQLDNLHLNIKQMKQSHKYPPHHLVEQYESNLAQFKQKILKQRAVIRHELSTYEKNYYAKHQTLPTEGDCALFKRLITKRNLANKLLQSWGITL